MATQAPPTGVEGSARPSVRDTWWFQAAVVLGIVVAFAVVVTRFAHRDVVSQWKVLASCPTAPGTVPVRVSTTPDLASCSAPPTSLEQGRGWPVVTFVVRGEAGTRPDVTVVRSDRSAGVVSLEYSGPTAATSRVLVFVEVDPSALPDVPFLIQDSAGTTTVARVPSR